MRVLVPLTGLLAGLVVPVLTASPAGAQCAPPDGAEVTYRISDTSFAYHPTNVHSDRVSLRHGGSITDSESRTVRVSASMTLTVSAEVGVVFAKASTSVRVTVGGSCAKSGTWSYTADVPADTQDEYRLHAYRYAVRFAMTKYRWVGGSTCDDRRVDGWPQVVRHAPVKADRNVLKLVRRAV